MTDETRSAQILVRMRPSLKDMAQKAAEADSRSLSSLIEKLLVEHLKAKGYMREPGDDVPPDFAPRGFQTRAPTQPRRSTKVPR
jgi:hypothetical protein